MNDAMADSEIDPVKCSSVAKPRGHAAGLDHHSRRHGGNGMGPEYPEN